MRGVGTSSGGAGSFGTEGDPFGGSGGRPKDGNGVGLRRDGREDGRGGHRGGLAEPDAEARARAFQGRIDDARRRLARGTGKDGHRAAGDPADADPRPAAPQFGAVLAVGERSSGKKDSGAGDAAEGGAPPADDQAGGPDDARAAPTVLHGAEALGDGSPRRLLAAAEAPADALAALFAVPLPPAAAASPADGPAVGPGAPAAVERRIADIAERVERAFQADLAAGAGGPIALRIPLDAVGDGLSSLTVTATAQGLDVTLLRAVEGPAPPPELLAATQALAERLQRRLGRGSVRVFDGVDAAGAARTTGGWADLSAVLGRSTG